MIFVTDSDGAAEAILSSISEQFPTAAVSEPDRHVDVYDTFDWRLFHRGGFVCHVRTREDSVLAWTGCDGLGPRRLDATDPPRFACDLTDRDQRTAMAAVIEMRRLLHRLTFSVETRGLRILDDELKTVASAVYEKGFATDPSANEEKRPMPSRIRVRPVRGYDQQYEEVVGFLRRSRKLHSREGHEIDLAFETIGCEPGDYSSKFRLDLNPKERADRTMKRIHLTLLEAMLRNESGTRENLDSEFLHDFRVAVRRTRSALGQVKQVFAEPITKRYRDAFSWLGWATGPVRDLDVYLLKLPELVGTRPPGERAALEPMVRFLEERHVVEQRKLARTLISPRYRRLVANWREFLEQPLAEGGQGPNAAVPILDLATERIGAVFGRVLRRGLAIGPSCPDSRLHKLRIECKKLRYLLEFFSSLYPTAEIAPTIKALKRLQTNLGDFNDLSVQSASLAGYAREMSERGIGTVDTWLATGSLVEHLRRLQEAERGRFTERFKSFSSQENSDRVRALFPAAGRRSAS